MIDLEFELYLALREHFGNRGKWPRGTQIARDLMKGVVGHLGQADTVRLLRCAVVANEAFHQSQSTRRSYSDFLSAATLTDFPDLPGDLDLLWPTLLAMHQTLGQEGWEAFVASALTAFEATPTLLRA